MLAEVQFSEARRDLSTLYDTVTNKLRPLLVRRRRSEEVLLLRRDLAGELLENFSLRPEVLTEDDGSVTLALDQLDLVVNASSLDEAVEELVREVKLYCQEYLERITLFLNAPNRHHHFPYVLRVALGKDDAAIRALLEPCRQDSES